MSLAVVAMLFAACDDGKKKEAEAKAEQEKMEMEAKMKADEEAKMMEAEKMKMRENSIASIAMKNENFSKKFRIFDEIFGLNFLDPHV